MDCWALLLSLQCSQNLHHPNRVYIKAGQISAADQDVPLHFNYRPQNNETQSNRNADDDGYCVRRGNAVINER